MYVLGNIGDSHSFGEPVGGVMVPGSISKSLSESFILVLSADISKDGIVIIR
jgi:hypothetical protein